MLSQLVLSKGAGILRVGNGFFGITDFIFWWILDVFDNYYTNNNRFLVHFKVALGPGSCNSASRF